MRTELNLRADLGSRQLATRLELAGWQLRLAREHGLIPEPDVDGRWSAELAERCLPRKPQIVAAFGDEPPVGAVKAAGHLASRVNLDVERADVEMLVARGELTVIGRYQQHPVYLVRDLEALDPQRVTEIVAARKGPLLDRVEARGAALILGCPKSLFDRFAAERALPTDQLGRYALADVRALAADGDLTARVEEDQRERAIAQARRHEERHEDTLRNWMLHCTAYLDRASDDPPDPAIIGRTLRSLTTARSAAGSHRT
ncbi:hypothetical protein GCM10010191_23130 [Actinomadura vinacea]|uniref:Uncharacterized protein n=1 Tax=Actinomadura vinacea TaxID=115336 RepID=A0ABN3ISN2_9ACTN